jgi:dipeptidase D
MDKAKEMGYSCRVDNAGNLLISPSNSNSVSKRKRIILQSHMDMVCEKNKSSNHNFSEDPLSLKTITRNDEIWVTAEGTTLGADNGIGIAFSLTIMDELRKKELELKDSIIEFLFTVEEETGLQGAFNIEKDFLEGKYLINLDSENENKFTIGCAGGLTTIARIPIEFKKVVDKTVDLIPLHLSIRGLQGGHSGVDINKGRGNAIKILARILWKVNSEKKITLSEISGGNLSNAIPREAECLFYVNESYVSNIVSILNEEKDQIASSFSKSEPNLMIEWTHLGRKDLNSGRQGLFSRKMTDGLISILHIMPNGSLRIDPDNPKLVITSSNLASIDKEKGKLKLTISHRSLYESSKRNIAERIEALLKLSRLNTEISRKGEYPGWQPDFESSLLKHAKKAYKNLFHEDPIIQTIHAGLETGILKKKFPEIEMISIGPTVEQGHSPKEKLKVNSVKKMWDFLGSLLKELDEFGLP